MPLTLVLLTRTKDDMYLNPGLGGKLQFFEKAEIDNDIVHEWLVDPESSEAEVISGAEDHNNAGSQIVEAPVERQNICSGRPRIRRWRDTARQPSILGQEQIYPSPHRRNIHRLKFRVIRKGNKWHHAFPHPFISSKSLFEYDCPTGTDRMLKALAKELKLPETGEPETAVKGTGVKVASPRRASLFERSLRRVYQSVARDRRANKSSLWRGTVGNSGYGRRDKRWRQGAIGSDKFDGKRKYQQNLTGSDLGCVDSGNKELVEERLDSNVDPAMAVVKRLTAIADQLVVGTYLNELEWFNMKKNKFGDHQQATGMAHVSRLAIAVR
ncbi:hypothetical protein BDP27DRAFT_1367933 [Rhodocollybia butyracea]|uniref:Uncharacterized protein n=1 Tax=Rhodocollybia butyracea TaxID=206335 RepID=A0A9P5PE28_9AGAR|nr:hypothetical protein BDP27DRAFT_1367933 [Rhodocollybia butyracea]